MREDHEKKCKAYVCNKGVSYSAQLGAWALFIYQLEPTWSQYTGRSSQWSRGACMVTVLQNLRIEFEDISQCRINGSRSTAQD